MKNKIFKNNNPQPALSRGAHLSYCRQFKLTAMGKALHATPLHCLLLLLTATFPALAQTYDLEVCVGEGFTLISTTDAPSASPVTYTWYENDVELPNSNTASLGLLAKPEGTYTYVRMAANEDCVDVPSNTYKVQVLYCWPPAAASTQTWTYGQQVWSDRITADVTNCTNTNTLSTSDVNATEYKVYNNRYYYTWTCAYNNRDVFCPSPWRLPTRTDFTTLMGAVSSSTLVSDWGFGGYASGSNMANAITLGSYWSYTENNASTVYRLYYSSGTMDQLPGNKFFGLQVRCVK